MFAPTPSQTPRACPAPLLTHFGPIAPTSWQKALFGYLAGLMAAVYPWPSLLLLTAVTWACVRGRDLLLLLLCLGLGLAVGYQQNQSPALNWKSKQLTHVRGRIESVRTYPGHSLRLIVANATDEQSGQPLPSKILWSWTDPLYLPEKGQEFTARLTLRRLVSRANFGLSDTQAQWARQGVCLQTFSHGPVQVNWDTEANPGLRQRLMNSVLELTPAGNAGAVIRALLFGDRFDLDPKFMDQIRRAGLSHSLALSGMHLALVSSLGLILAWAVTLLRPTLLLRWPRQNIAAVLATPLALGYLWLGAWPPSLARAAVMLTVLVVCQVSGRVRHTQDALILAVAILVLENPNAIHDLSLQLSVLAVLGILWFLPICTPALSGLVRSKTQRLLRGFLLIGMVSICANTMILPVLAAYFGEVSAHLYLNLLWLPVLGLLVMPLACAGLLLVILGLPSTWASWLFELSGLGIKALEWGLTWLDQHSCLQASVAVRPNGLGLAGYWLILTGAAVLWSRPQRHKALVALGCGLLLLGSAPLDQLLTPAQQVELTVLDTGMSQAVHIHTGSGRSVLIDGGGFWSRSYDMGRAVVGPSLTYAQPPKLDMVLLSHVDADHLRGLFHILRTFEIGWFGWTEVVDDSRDTEELLDILRTKAHKVRPLQAGERIDLDSGLWLEILHPGPSTAGLSKNDTSLVVRLVRNGHGLALIPGDAEQLALNQILDRGEPVSAKVLILPHHGSRTSYHLKFLDQVQPQWAVAACGPDNRFNFPHPEVIRACEDNKIEVLTTATCGAIRFRWPKTGPPVLTLARDRRMAE